MKTKARSLWTQAMADAQREAHFERSVIGLGVRRETTKLSWAAKAVKRFGKRRDAVAFTEPDVLPPRWMEVQISELEHGGARLFAARATKAGYTVAARRAGAAEQVGVKELTRNVLWMRASWVAGVSRGVMVGSVLLKVKAAETLFVR